MAEAAPRRYMPTLAMAAEILEDMLSLGMTGVRLNLSHMSLKDAEPMLSNLRRAMRNCGKH